MSKLRNLQEPLEQADLLYVKVGKILNSDSVNDREVREALEAVGFLETWLESLQS